MSCTGTNAPLLEYVGTPRFSCPCCKGGGEHGTSDHRSSDGHGPDYPCGPCRGSGAVLCSECRDAPATLLGPNDEPLCRGCADVASGMDLSAEEEAAAYEAMWDETLYSGL